MGIARQLLDSGLTQEALLDKVQEHEQLENVYEDQICGLKTTVWIFSDKSAIRFAQEGAIEVYCMNGNRGAKPGASSIDRSEDRESQNSWDRPSVGDLLDRGSQS